ncbi:DinB family protein [Paenibacillus monticola]|uniref:DinB family protein n=1 Tax=Paenibacillus monticola TaxID=2666075 RepID=A0A7X2H1D5_9BACL|nr:DinB family protein [Paenibacillus monticola]MRN51755.1 DinB family protein [Paenibacillus monticola]
MHNKISEVLLQNWDYSMDVEDWSPPLSDALAGVDHLQASWKPQGGAANSIWETVNHLTYYKERLLKKLKGLPQLPDVDSNDDTFIVTVTGEEEWEKAVAALKTVHASLREVIEALEEGAYDWGGSGHAPGEEVMSLILHDAYHTGQIVLIRKLQGSWPSRRSFD